MTWAFFHFYSDLYWSFNGDYSLQVRNSNDPLNKILVWHSTWSILVTNFISYAFSPDVFATWNSGCIKSKIFLDLNLPVLNNQCWCIYVIQISNGTNNNRQSINQSLKLGFQYFNTLIEWLYNFDTYVQAYWKTLRYNFAKLLYFRRQRRITFTRNLGWFRSTTFQW